jgi:hypothetical protein
LVLRSALLWHITRLRMVIPYRPFGTTCGSHLRGSRISIRLLVLLHTWRWDRYFVPKRRCGSTNIRCVISQKSADPIHGGGRLKSRMVLCLIALGLFRIPSGILQTLCWISAFHKCWELNSHTCMKEGIVINS